MSTTSPRFVTQNALSCTDHTVSSAPVNVARRLTIGVDSIDICSGDPLLGCSNMSVYVVSVHTSNLAHSDGRTIRTQSIAALLPAFSVRMTFTLLEPRGFLLRQQKGLCSWVYTTVEVFSPKSTSRCHTVEIPDCHVPMWRLCQ